MSFWPSDTAGKIADVLSIIAFLAAWYAGSSTKKLKRRIDKGVGYEAIAAKLKAHCEMIQSFSVDANYPTDQQTLISVHYIEGILNGIRLDVHDDIRRSWKSTMSALQKFKNHRDEGSIGNLLGTTYELISHMETVSEGMKFRNE
jgi:hypothetical protein